MFSPTVQAWKMKTAFEQVYGMNVQSKIYSTYVYVCAHIQIHMVLLL